MKLKPVDLLNVFFEPEQGRRRLVGRLARRQREILFEYDAAFLASKLEISPFKLPLRPGVVVGDPMLFSGLMGVFEDSLPDGWGRLLLDRRLAQEGLEPSALTPLDRLARVGSRSMGALIYEPELGIETTTIVDLAEIASETEAVLEDVAGPGLDRLIALGGSPQGARPKALVQLGPDGALLYGAREIRPGFTPYLVKFRAKEDDAHAGLLEHAYAKMASAAGIDVLETRMLGRTGRHPGYFAARRFDRVGAKKLHLHTLCGLLHAPHTYPSIGYRQLLQVTRSLTRNEAEVAEMFRRACFNVLAHNRDDHTKNFAFLMDEEGTWRTSPAYDLTYSAGPGGEHSLLIGNEGRNPTTAHLEALAREVGLKRWGAIIEQVRAAVGRFLELGDEVGLPKRVLDRVAKPLGIATPRIVKKRAAQIRHTKKRSR